MTDLKDLARRVSELQGPSYEMDCAIWDAIYPGERAGRFERLTAKGQPYHMRLAPVDMDGYVKPLRSFTASLDAAMTLVTDGWMWSVGSDGPDDEPWACVTEIAEPCRDISFDAATHALALTAAALIARSEA